MGKAYDLFTRKEIKPEPRRRGLVEFFAERSFCTDQWRNRVLEVLEPDARQVLGILKGIYGFHDHDEAGFDPGEFDVRDKTAVIALRAFPMNDEKWQFQCGFYVCIGGDWYFKRDENGNFEREVRGQSVLIKANPKKYPHEE